MPELPYLSANHEHIGGHCGHQYHDVMSCAGRLCRLWFSGAAQMDVYGNINTTVIGDWKLQKVRLPAVWRK